MLCEKRPPGAQKVMSTIYQAKLAWMQMCLLSKCLYMQTRSKFAPASTYKQMSGQLMVTYRFSTANSKYLLPSHSCHKEKFKTIFKTEFTVQPLEENCQKT